MSRQGEGEATASHSRMLDSYSASRNTTDFCICSLTVYICPRSKGRVLRQRSSDVMVCAIGITVSLFGVIMVLAGVRFWLVGVACQEGEYLCKHIPKPCQGGLRHSRHIARDALVVRG